MYKSNSCLCVHSHLGGIWSLNIVSIGSSTHLCKLLHFKQYFVIRVLEILIEIRLSYKVVSHSRRLGVSSCVTQSQWFGCFFQDLIFLSETFGCLLAVIVGNYITNWCTWPIWSSILKLFFRKVNSSICELLLQSWQTLAKCLSKSTLSSSCGYFIRKCNFVSLLEVLLISWMSTNVMS